MADQVVAVANSHLVREQTTDPYSHTLVVGSSWAAVVVAACTNFVAVACPCTAAVGGPWVVASVARQAAACWAEIVVAAYRDSSHAYDSFHPYSAYHLGTLLGCQPS